MRNIRPETTLSIFSSCHRELYLSFKLPPNASTHLLLKAGARHEWTLEAVACTPVFGQDSTPEMRKSGSFAS